MCGRELIKENSQLLKIRLVQCHKVITQSWEDEGAYYFLWDEINMLVNLIGECIGMLLTGVELKAALTKPIKSSIQYGPLCSLKKELQDKKPQDKK